MRADREQSVGTEQVEPEVGKAAYRFPVKGFVVGIIGSLILTYIGIYGELFRFILPVDVNSAPPIGSMIFVFLMLGINYLIYKLQSGFLFSKADIAVAYIMTAIAGIMSQVGYLGAIPLIVGSFSALSMTKPLWQPLYNILGDWVLVKDSQIAMGFWMGGSSSVPYAAWIRPVVFFTVFYGIALFVLICLGVIVRKHWMDREHLTFPLTQPVLSVMGETSSEENRVVWRVNLFYIGIAVAWVLTGFPTRYIPGFPLPSPIDLGTILDSYPFDVLKHPHGFYFTFDPLLIGLGYLIPLEMSFSIAFFYLLSKVLQVVYNSLGIAYVNNFPLILMHGSISFGAHLAIGVYTLWFTRRYLIEVIRSAQTEEDRQVRMAMICIVAGWIILVILAKVFLNISPIISAIYLLLTFLVALAFARIRAEAGVPTSFGAPDYITHIAVRIFGQPTLGVNNVLALGFFFPLEYVTFISTTAWTVESFSMARACNTRKRYMVSSIVVGFLIVAVIGFLWLVSASYTHGGLLMNQGYVSRSSNVAFGRAAEGDGLQPSGLHLPFNVIGFVVALGLMFMRIRFLWWPFHPLGFAFGHNIFSMWMWGPLLMAWVTKSIVVRYGGWKVAKKITPFFLGLIIGAILAQALSLAIDSSLLLFNITPAYRM